MPVKIGGKTHNKAFEIRWNENWSKYIKKGRFKRTLCNMGELPTTDREINNAARVVKIASKVTNAISRNELEKNFDLIRGSREKC